MNDASLRQTLFSIVLLFSDAAAVAADPALLQDLCVADLNSTLRVNGFACKPAAAVSETDFSFAGLATGGDTNTTVGSKASAATVEKIPGLNTLGISMARVDYAPGGLVHFQKNAGVTPAAALAAFNSQLPGTQSLAFTLFTASPPVPDAVLEKAFQIGPRELEKIKDRLTSK
ncbi:hypothetical protein J5N97_018460 [Dioscorea zingiberensis]|uniref:Germin-like protein n=1 Tax=Dioscorea zingiberensis TaxID=325984 RepID=A0A9D5CQK9_9LILI|nr:hypothetical protein J5N97_018460 [Dioscorea zingiberensis]